MWLPWMCICSSYAIPSNRFASFRPGELENTHVDEQTHLLDYRSTVCSGKRVDDRIEIVFCRLDARSAGTRPRQVRNRCYVLAIRFLYASRVALAPDRVRIDSCQSGRLRTAACALCRTRPMR
jgi:hypothetical protein